MVPAKSHYNQVFAVSFADCLSFANFTFKLTHPVFCFSFSFPFWWLGEGGQIDIDL